MLEFFDRGYAYFLQQNQTAAIADFEHAISAAPSSNTAVYAALMLHVAMKRQGQSDTTQLAPVVSAADLSKWPGPVLKLDLAELTADEVMVAAANPDADTQKGQVCEANFYTGEDALMHQQKTTALARFKAAVDKCPKNYIEYAAAQAELKRLGGTATAQKPATPQTQKPPAPKP